MLHQLDDVDERHQLNNDRLNDAQKQIDSINRQSEQMKGDLDYFAQNLVNDIVKTFQAINDKVIKNNAIETGILFAGIEEMQSQEHFSLECSERIRVITKDSEVLAQSCGIEI